MENMHKNEQRQDWDARYIHDCICIALRGVLTSVLQESQGLTTYAFVMLLLAMVYLDMLTFRLIVVMVADFAH